MRDECLAAIHYQFFSEVSVITFLLVFSCSFLTPTEPGTRGRKGQHAYPLGGEFYGKKGHELGPRRVFMAGSEHFSHQRAPACLI